MLSRNTSKSNFQWKTFKRQASQAATYQAEMHDLHAEIRNIQDKSELTATLSAKMVTVESPKPVVETEPEVFRNTTGPCSSETSKASWEGPFAKQRAGLDLSLLNALRSASVPSAVSTAGNTMKKG